MGRLQYSIVTTSWMSFASNSTAFPFTSIRASLLHAFTFRGRSFK